MALHGISEINFTNAKFETTTTSKNVSQEPIFKMDNNVAPQQEFSDDKLETEMFIDELMRILDKSKMEKSSETVKYYLKKIIEKAQILNGLQKDNLKPQGNSEQNRIYNIRIQEIKQGLKDYTSFVGSNLEVVQEFKTGLYKISINNKLYNIPERKVEIVKENTEDGIELIPSIVEKQNTLKIY